MIVYKCKMCDGNLTIEPGMKLTKCAYCDTFQSVPSCNDEKKSVLFNRANRFRQNGEFDKAYSIYEHILEEDATDPEIYWSLVLCKFGIEYVEDPGTKHRKPTINRIQQHSILQDADYLATIERADDETKKYYMEEATNIDQIQKSFFMIARDTQAYDIFICYKEKDAEGNRTKSSVMAQNLYERFEAAGYRTFFARISLEDKLGSAYEPYIYAALHSARVMLVVGSQKEEFTAPWVKNEWSRYFLVMKEDPAKKLIPCYCDVDVDDLPDEFQILQGQDMNKVGFEQDLLRGITKILAESKKQETNGVKDPIEELLKNAETCLFLKNYEQAAAAYANMCNKVPGDCRGWWGRIRAASKEFTDTDSLKKEYANFKSWMGYVKKLADGASYKEMSDQYVAYLERASQQMAYEEMNAARKRRDDCCTAGQNNYVELRNRQSSKSVRLQELEDNLDEIDVSHVAYAKAATVAKRKALMKQFNLLLWFAGIVLSIILGVNFYSWGMYAEILVSVMLVVLFVVLICANRSERKKCLNLAVDYRKTAEDMVESHELNEAMIQDESVREAEYQLYLANKTEVLVDIVENADKYLTYEIEKIRELLLGIMRRDIGENCVLDQQLLEIREHVFQKID